jgi:hypothetical protein
MSLRICSKIGCIEGHNYFFACAVQPRVKLSALLDSFNQARLWFTAMPVSFSTASYSTAIMQQRCLGLNTPSPNHRAIIVHTQFRNVDQKIINNTAAEDMIYIGCASKAYKADAHLEPK